MASPLAPFQKRLAQAGLSALGLSFEIESQVEAQIRIPEPEHGDLALACFELARHKKQSPEDAARQVANALSGQKFWAKVEAAGPYVNVRFSPAALAEAVVPAARSPDFGKSDAGRGKTVVIDFSSPNIAKPLAFHHIRSTVLGAAIARIHAAQAWRVVGINYLGDWGKQFGLLATGFARYGDPAKRADAKHLIEVYVRANREADVESRQAAIAAPNEARQLAKGLSELRAQFEAESDPKEKKKLEKNLRSFEKKLRAKRALPGEADPLADLDSWFSSLEEKKAVAEKSWKTRSRAIKKRGFI